MTTYPSDALQKLWIPGRLPGLNEIINASKLQGSGVGWGGKRWNKYAEMKKTWSFIVGNHAKNQGFEKVDRGYFSYLFVEPDRRRDPSNFLAGGIKIIEDALQEVDLLANDGWRNIDGIAPYWTTGDEYGVLVVVDEFPLSKIEMMQIREEA